MFLKKKTKLTKNNKNKISEALSFGADGQLPADFRYSRGALEPNPCKKRGLTLCHISLNLVSFKNAGTYFDDNRKE
jgi:hypothetical protein